MGTAYNTNVVTDGLIACWDAGNRRCGTPSAGGTWTGLGVNAPATLVNSGASAPEFADISLGAIAFDGTNDKVTVANTTDIDGAGGLPLIYGYIFLLCQLTIIPFFLSIMVMGAACMSLCYI